MDITFKNLCNQWLFQGCCCKLMVFDEISLWPFPCQWFQILSLFFTHVLSRWANRMLINDIFLWSFDFQHAFLLIYNLELLINNKYSTATAENSWNYSCYLCQEGTIFSADQFQGKNWASEQYGILSRMCTWSDENSYRFKSREPKLLWKTGLPK